MTTHARKSCKRIEIIPLEKMDYGVNGFLNIHCIVGQIIKPFIKLI